MSDDERFGRVEVKLDKIVEHMASIDVTLAKQHESLKDHIRRTEILEAAVKPMVKHEHMLLGIAKLGGILIAFCAALAGVVELLQYLRN